MMGFITGIPMVPAVQTVSCAAALAMPASAAALPAGIWTAFAVVNKVHSVWRWYRWSGIYSNPDNFSQLATGHALNFTVGDYLGVRIAAHCVLISSKIIECTDQQVSLSKAYRKWKEALTGTYSAPMTCDWKKKMGWVSPSSTQKWSLRFYRVIWHVCYIARRTLKLITYIFKLSMKTMDAIEAFSLSPSTRNEAVNEVFLNSIKCLNSLEQNQHELLAKLQKNKQVIEKILKGVGTVYNADQLIDYVSGTMEKLRSVNHTTQGLFKRANGAIYELFLDSMHGLAALSGTIEYMPNFLIPKDEEADDTLYGMEKSKERYPPIHWVTRVDCSQSVPKEKTKRYDFWEKEALPFQTSRYLKKITQYSLFAR